MSRLGRWCFRNRRRVVALWVVAVAALLAAGNAWGGTFHNDFRVADSESQIALDRLQTSFPSFAGDPLSFVFTADAGIDAPRVRALVEPVLDEIAAGPGVRGVVSPYDGPALVDAERATAIAQIQMADFGPEVDLDLVRRIIDAADQVSEAPGIDAAVGGPTAVFAELEPPGSREGIGVLLALFVLFATFGSLVAAGLPIVVALGGLGAGMALVLLLTRLVNVTTFAPSVAAMIGLGVGIDYALFIVTRHRQGLDDGLDVEDAAAGAVATAGRAVVFAGATVVISLLGMLLIGVSMVVGLALGAALAVACTALAAVTLMPAALGFIGGHIDRFSLPAVRRRAPGGETRWHRWGRFIQRRPWPALVVSLAVLLGLSAPALGIELGGPHFGGGPESHSSRRAYDLITESFGEGYNGPLMLVAELGGEHRGQTGDLDPVIQAAAEAPGVAAVLAPMPSPDGDVAVIVVIPTSAPHSTPTQDLVHRLRHDVIPAATATSGVDVAVSGVTALFADMADLLNRRLPLFIGAVVALSFVLLMVVFRSLLVPAKAAVMNLLSIGVAYGIVVAVFQWGWGAGLVGVDRPGPIMAFIPVMLFAILFGLSMDYEVFLLSRVREEYHRSGDNALAVTDGLAATGRVITAAAAIMMLIFLSFVLGDDPIIKTFGLGLAAAVLIDATIVRTVLVPATMELLGDANWWFPARLERWVPHVDLEPGAPAEGRAPAADRQRVVMTEGARAWLDSLEPRLAGRAVAHLDGAVSAGRNGHSELRVPLGHVGRSLDVSATGARSIIGVKGRSEAASEDWEAVRARLLQHPEAERGHREATTARRLGDAIRAQRLARGLAVADLSGRSGIDASTLARLEAGDLGIDLALLLQVCSVLEIELVPHAGGTPVPQPDGG